MNEHARISQPRLIDKSKWFALFLAIVHPTPIEVTAALKTIEGAAARAYTVRSAGDRTPVLTIARLRESGLKWAEIAAQCGENSHALQKRYSKAMREAAMA